MSKESRFKKDYRTNVSKLHKAVGDMLRASPLLANYRIYQEYPVNMISPYFDSGREKFDWIVMDLMVVIECHGKQHYEPVRFGGIAQEEAEVNFKNQVIRDLSKKQAVKQAGWTYVVFKYDEKDISVAALMKKITTEQAIIPEEEPETTTYYEIAKKIKNKRSPKFNKDYHVQQLEKAREYRRKWYRIFKQRKKDEANRS